MAQQIPLIYFSVSPTRSPKMNASELVWCRQKIERAKQHVDDLNAVHKTFAASKPYEIVPKYNTESKQLLLVFECAPIPPRCSLLIGEILYQLRSALDHLVRKLVIQAGGTPNSLTQFPIYKIKRGPGFTYESRGTQVIKGVSSSAAKKIEELQPFQASTAPEDDPLWQIHELNNIDKHRFLITTRACLGKGNFHLKFDPPIPDGVKASSMQGEIIENGTIFMSLSPIRPTKVQINGHLSVEIVLNETSLPINQPIVPLLAQFCDYVCGVIDSFDQEFS
jgi:hypothetical protein